MRIDLASVIFMTPNVMPISGHLAAERSDAAKRSAALAGSASPSLSLLCQERKSRETTFSSKLLRHLEELILTFIRRRTFNLLKRGCALCPGDNVPACVIR